MRTWTFETHRIPVPGVWDNEPDKAHWIDEDTDLDCLIVRHAHAGHLCGYVGVPPGHPFHGCHYDAVDPHPYVHGGLTFSGLCQEGVKEDAGICHTPGVGRPEKVWWLGFDCAHGGDQSPRWDILTSLGGWQTYKTFEYVQQECRSLAKQLAEVTA